MIRLPLIWIPGLIAGLAITTLLSLRGILDNGFFSRILSMAIMLICAFIGKAIIDFARKKGRNDISNP